MERYLMLLQPRPEAMPADPTEHIKMHKMWLATVDHFIEKGVIEEIGFFLETSEKYMGYAICKGTADDIVEFTWSFLPGTVIRVHEITSYSKGKEFMMEMMTKMEV